MSKDAFEPVPSPFNFSQAEQDIIAFWKAGQTYHKSLAQRADAPSFVFYEGPPTCFVKHGASSRISASSAPGLLPDRAVSLLRRIGAKLSRPRQHAWARDSDGIFRSWVLVHRVVNF